jgi:ABC-2 type transport system ATP-binding protein
MIEARSLSRKFGRLLAVDAVSLTVPDGAILALLGPNGAGKTTTVRMLAGLVAPTSGEATVAGIDVRANPTAVRLRTGLVTDVPGLYERMTARAYLDFFGSIYGLDAANRKARIEELLTVFDLRQHANQRLGGYSKGMQQKMALIRALLHQPAALFLDEPTSGLDPQTAQIVRGLITDLKQSSRSIILCTHDLDEAQRLADEVAIIQRGRIVASGNLAALRNDASRDVLVRVEFAASCPDALAWLQDVDGLNGVALRSNGHGPDGAGVLEYRTNDARGVNPKVLARLVAGGGQVVSVTCDSPTLEDIYFRAMAAAEAMPEARS